MNVKVNDKVVETLLKLGFEKESAESMKRFENTTQKVLGTWTDSDGTAYITVEMCCELPRSCCEIILGKDLTEAFC